MTKLHTMLKRLGACSDAVNWSNGKKLQEAWNTCERPDWMLWLCAKMIGKKGWPTHQQIVLAVCDCAETTLPIFEKKNPNDNRPRKAIETARKWANGKATIDEVRAATDAAYDAAADAATAYSAPYAAYDAAADAAYDAYDAAANAAAHAAYAADAAYRATLSSRGKELADLIRAKLVIPSEGE